MRVYNTKEANDDSPFRRVDSYSRRRYYHIVLDAQGATGVTTFPCSIHGTLVEETQGTLWYAQTQEATQRLLSKIALTTGAIFLCFW